MQAETLTTVGQLKPGDIFCMPVRGVEILFIKKDDQLTIKCKEKFQCTAMRIDTLEPKPFKKETTVTYKKSKPSLLTQNSKP